MERIRLPSFLVGTTEGAVTSRVSEINCGVPFASDDLELDISRRKLKGVFRKMRCTKLTAGHSFDQREWEKVFDPRISGADRCHRVECTIIGDCGMFYAACEKPIG